MTEHDDPDRSMIIIPMAFCALSGGLFVGLLWAVFG